MKHYIRMVSPQTIVTELREKLITSDNPDSEISRAIKVNKSHVWKWGAGRHQRAHRRNAGKLFEYAARLNCPCVENLRSFINTNG